MLNIFPPSKPFNNSCPFTLLFSRSVVSDFFLTPWTVACQAFLPFNNSWSLLKLMSIESVMPSNRLILCHPLLLLSPIFPSIRVLSNESALHIRWPKYCSFSINPSSECSGLISFSIDWFDLLALQRVLKSLLLNAWDKHSNLVHWEDLEGSGGEGGGRWDRDGEHM